MSLKLIEREYLLPDRFSQGYISLSVFSLISRPQDFVTEEGSALRSYLLLMVQRILSDENLRVEVMHSLINALPDDAKIEWQMIDGAVKARIEESLLDEIDLRYGSQVKDVVQWSLMDCANYQDYQEYGDVPMITPETYSSYFANLLENVNLIARDSLEDQVQLGDIWEKVFEAMSGDEGEES